MVSTGSVTSARSDTGSLEMETLPRSTIASVAATVVTGRRMLASIQLIARLASRLPPHDTPLASRFRGRRLAHRHHPHWRVVREREVPLGDHEVARLHGDLPRRRVREDLRLPPLLPPPP